MWRMYCKVLCISIATLIKWKYRKSGISHITETCSCKKSNIDLWLLLLISNLFMSASFAMDSYVLIHVQSIINWETRMQGFHLLLVLFIFIMSYLYPRSLSSKATASVSKKPMRLPSIRPLTVFPSLILTTQNNKIRPK